MALAVGETERLLAGDADLAQDGRVSFEPGGQLEISPPPSASISALLASVENLRTRVERCLAVGGAQLYSSGLNPWHTADELGLQTPRPRYIAMQDHFDSIGPYGRRMMRQSLALQISLDLGSAETAGRRWTLANLAGPCLCGAFANSPVVAGEELGLPGARSQAWQMLDPSRTGFDGAQVGPSAPAAYGDFALGATYIDLGAGFGDQQAVPDIQYHLSTLFPPVRPRRHLEVRFIDALPARWTAVPVALLVGLLYDQRATSAALEVLAGTRLDAQTWRRSCELGMREPRLRADATALFDIALGALGRFPSGYFPSGARRILTEYRERFLAAGRCPADDQLDAFRQHPEDLTQWK
jgi:glutamate--cysteine ligase